MKKPVIIHYLGYDRDVGGILSHVRSLAAEATRTRRIGIVRLCFKETRRPRLSFFRESGPMPESGSFLTFLGAFPLALCWTRILNRKQHYFFHGHTRLGLFIVLWLKFLGQQRMLASVHCYGNNRMFYRWAKALLGPRLMFLSKDMCRYYGLSEKQLSEEVCIPPPMPRPQVSRVADTDNAKICALGLGAIEPRKGWHVLMEAIEKMSPSARERFRFTHFGNELEGSEMRRYAEFCYEKSRAWHTAVSWKGWSENPWNEMEGKIQLLILPSINEPFSNVALEAASRGIAVLSADSGGIADLIRKGEMYGWCFRTNDAGSLAEALDELLAEPEKLKNTDSEASNLWKQIGAPAAVKRWEEIYDNILNKEFFNH